MATMNVGPIPEFLGLALSAWLGVLALLMLYAMYSGRIGMNGLFATDYNGDGVMDEFHPERVQLFLISAVGLVGYVMTTVSAVNASTTDLTVLPDVPDELLMLLGASNTFFLSGKFSRTLKRG
jgi:hypothetical protein